MWFQGNRRIFRCLLRVLNRYPACHFLICVVTNSFVYSAGGPVAMMCLRMLHQLCAFAFVVKHYQHEAGNQYCHFHEQGVEV